MVELEECIANDCIYQNKNLNVVAINASYPPETIAHLINYDKHIKNINLKVEPIENGLQVDDHKIKLVADRNPENLPWKELDIDIAIDATLANLIMVIKPSHILKQVPKKYC